MCEKLSDFKNISDLAAHMKLQLIRIEPRLKCKSISVRKKLPWLYF